MECPNKMELREYVWEKLLDTESEFAIAEHINGCPKCLRIAQEEDKLKDFWENYGGEFYDFSYQMYKKASWSKEFVEVLKRLNQRTSGGLFVIKRYLKNLLMVKGDGVVGPIIQVTVDKDSPRIKGFSSNTAISVTDSSVQGSVGTLNGDIYIDRKISICVKVDPENILIRFGTDVMLPPYLVLIKEDGKAVVGRAEINEESSYSISFKNIKPGKYFLVFEPEHIDLEVPKKIEYLPKKIERLHMIKKIFKIGLIAAILTLFAISIPLILHLSSPKDDAAPVCQKSNTWSQILSLRGSEDVNTTFIKKFQNLNNCAANYCDLKISEDVENELTEQLITIGKEKAIDMFSQHLCIYREKSVKLQSIKPNIPIFKTVPKCSDSKIWELAYSGTEDITFCDILLDNDFLFSKGIEERFLTKKLQRSQFSQEVIEGLVYSTKGEIYSKIGEYSKAIEMYEKALHLYDKVEAPPGQVYTLAHATLLDNNHIYANAYLNPAKGINWQSRQSVGYMHFSCHGKFVDNNDIRANTYLNQSYQKAREMYSQALPLRITAPRGGIWMLSSNGIKAIELSPEQTVPGKIWRMGTIQRGTFKVAPNQIIAFNGTEYIILYDNEFFVFNGAEERCFTNKYEKAVHNDIWACLKSTRNIWVTAHGITIEKAPFNYWEQSFKTVPKYSDSKIWKIASTGIEDLCIKTTDYENIAKFHSIYVPAAVTPCSAIVEQNPKTVSVEFTPCGKVGQSSGTPIDSGFIPKPPPSALPDIAKSSTNKQCAATLTSVKQAQESREVVNDMARWEKSGNQAACKTVKQIEIGETLEKEKDEAELKKKKEKEKKEDKIK